MKRINAFIDNHPKITFLLGLGIILSTFSFVERYHFQSTQTTITKVALSNSTQVKDVTYATDLATLTPNNIRAESGLLPVFVLSEAEYTNIMTSSKSIVDATINPDTRITAASLKDKAGKLGIYTAYFLPSESASLLNEYAKAKANVQITPPLSASSPSPLVFAGRYGYLENPNASSAVAPSITTTGLIPTPWRIAILLVLLLLMVLFVNYRSNRRHIQEELVNPSGGNAVPPPVRFKDVAGVDEAVDELREVVMLLKNPKAFESVGAKINKGILLVGPPGTGKTLLAKAVAGEAGVPFFSQGGSDFMNMFVGAGAKAVRELFTKARKHPEGAIIFIDEIDTIGKARKGKDDPQAHNEQEGTLNALLNEMDGFEDRGNIIVIAATNRQDILDPALTRSGRFGKEVQVPLPDRIGREAILKVYAESKPIDSGVDLTAIAKRTPQLSGAALAELVNEAALRAGREGRKKIDASDFDEAVAIAYMGKPRKSAYVTEHDEKVTAYHEAGHTLVGMLTKDSKRPISVSIVPRGFAGGVTWFEQTDDVFLTRNAALADLVVALGGRAAEEIFLDGEFTSGASSDLQNATSLATEMITKYGMTDGSLMSVSEGWLATGGEITDSTAKAVEKLLQDARDKARDTIRSNEPLLQILVKNLLVYKTLIESQIEEIRNGATEVTPVKSREFTKKLIPGIVDSVKDVVDDVIDKVGDILTPDGGSDGVIGNVKDRFRRKEPKGTASAFENLE